MYNEHHYVFSKAMMTGLFVGIIDTLICLAYNIGYRYVTGYFPAELINVSSLIFIVNLTMLVMGLVYYVLGRLLPKGDFVYLVFILLLTAFLAWKSAEVVRFNDAHLDSGFHGLLTGIVLILGISSAFIPLLYHNRKFIENVI